MLLRRAMKVGLGVKGEQSMHNEMAERLVTLLVLTSGRPSRPNASYVRASGLPWHIAAYADPLLVDAALDDKKQ